MDRVVKTAGKPRILVAPLDWGLGHATRCVPVVYELISQGAEVWLAGEGAQVKLLKEEFPELPFLLLQGYRVKYSGRGKTGFLRSILMQVPKIFTAIKKENQWLKKVVAENHIDAVISDNRYGLYHPSIPSVFITHQLRIKSPFGKISEELLQKRNYRFINRFSECWIPDEEKGGGLSGELSHPSTLPKIPVVYTGVLSRLKKNNTAEKKNHLFISLSGPEPQRTQLENQVIDAISHYNGTAVIARGLPGETKLIPSTNDLHFYNHLPAVAYNKEMERAEYVIARSGYSTIMDLARLEKKSILIPTPGQTEQEYLGKYLHEKKMAVCIDQPGFSLNDALKKAVSFEYKVACNTDTSKLVNAIDLLLKKIGKQNMH